MSHRDVDDQSEAFYIGRTKCNWLDPEKMMCSSSVFRSPCDIESCPILLEVTFVGKYMSK